jgi:NADH-quinone oxidoreductase subunit N
MSTEIFQKIAETNTWGWIAPELAMGVLALSLLVLEVILPKVAHGAIPRIAIIGQLVILGYVVTCTCAGTCPTGEAFGGMLYFDGTGQLFRVFFLGASIFVSYLGMVSLDKRTLPQVEYFHILLVITAALMLLAQANHFVMLFVALETATVGFYILVSYFRHTTVSLEAGLKYLIMGALSSTILLFGIVLLYGAGSNPALAGSSQDSLNFGNLAGFLEANPNDTLGLIGMILVISGVAFKIGAFPFQIWIPDVYQGAPLPTTALLSVSSKAAGFAMLLSLSKVFSALGDWFYPLLSALAVLTILFGNFAALTQRNLKRVIGLSGVSHAGFLLIGVIAARTVDWASTAILFYLFAYLLASAAVFSVLVHLNKDDDSDLTLDDLGDLAKKNGFLGLALAVGVGSLAGIPPLAGFIGKLLIFIAAFKAELYGLLGVAIFGVVVSIYYYFGILKSAFFDVWQFQTDEEEAPTVVPGSALGFLGKVAIVIAIAGTLLLGFYQSPFSSWLVG